MNHSNIALFRLLFLFTFFWLIEPATTWAGEKDILELLQKKIPGASIEEIDHGRHFSREFVIMLRQPLDHSNPELGTFEQRIFLAHYDRKAPMVMVTEGYSAYPQYYELTEMLTANQLIVEYRYCGSSKPEDTDYTYLTNDQAVEDLHRIRRLLGKVYCGNWVSTGISKGGTTCLIYKYRYPKDVKVVVPYVAPLPRAREDKRCDDHIRSVGSEACRAALSAFQKEALAFRGIILPMIDSMARADGLTFKRIGRDAAFEYAVLEFTFSFWQWGHDCSRIPDTLDAHRAFDLLNEVVGFDFYADETIEYFEPAFYQFMSENGYYGFIHDHLVDDLLAVKSFDNRPFAPKSTPGYDADYLKYVRVFLYHHGDRIIYIQGGNDPWSACGFVPPAHRDALLMVLENGDHRTRIRSFSQAEQQQIYDKLSEWLDVELAIDRPSE